MGTDLISSQQLAASFRGVPFLVRSERSEPSGKRHISHEYPNSNRRYVEDLGEIPPMFTISAFVHGVNYLKNASELEEALNQDGPGTLVMPNFGTHSVYAMPFPKSASQRSVGEISFNLTFYAGTDVIAPSESLASAESVFDAGDSARQALSADFEAAYNIPTEMTSVETATNDALFLNEFSVGVVKDIVKDLSDVVEVSSRIKDGVSNLIKNPINLSAAFFGSTGLYQEISTSLQPSLLGIDSALSISKATLGDTQSTITGFKLWHPTTVTRINRNLNRENMVGASQIAGLIMSYEQAAGSDYGTQDEIKNVRELIESEYNRIMQDSITNRDYVQSRPGVRNAVEDVRRLALEVMEQKQQQSFILTDIKQQTAASNIVLTYKYYAEDFLNSDQLDEKSQTIRNLNKGKKANALFGDLKIVQGQR